MKFRIASKVPAKDVAKKLGISKSYLSDIERGRRAISFALGVAYEKAVKQLTKGK